MTRGVAGALNGGEGTCWATAPTEAKTEKIALRHGKASRKRYGLRIWNKLLGKKASNGREGPLCRQAEPTGTSTF